MNKTKCLDNRIRLLLCGALLAALTGCVGVVGTGYVEPGYAEVYVPAPEVVVFGGYDRGHYDRDDGRRGRESRGGDRR